MNSTYQKFQDLIENALQNLNLPDRPERLYDPIRYTLRMKGKRLRPLLTLAACDLAGGDPEAALPAALGMEIFHNFTLLHDDIMDQAPLRRGKETVHTRWNPNIAILSGDTMFAMAYQYLLRSPVNQLLPILNTFTKTAIEVCEGQQMDMDFEQQTTISLEDYLQMIRLKTAVLLGASLKIGALVANSDTITANHLDQFGTHMGMVFQLQDDYLDTFGSTEKFGKHIGGDILAGKKTFFYVKCLELANPHDRTELLNLYNQNNQLVPPSEKIEKVIDLFLRYDLKNQAQQLMEEFFAMALKCLDEIQASNHKKAMLADYAHWLYKREF